jgi:hypothetical protein
MPFRLPSQKYKLPDDVAAGRSRNSGAADYVSRASSINEDGNVVNEISIVTATAEFKIVESPLSFPGHVTPQEDGSILLFYTISVSGSSAATAAAVGGDPHRK